MTRSVVFALLGLLAGCHHLAERADEATPASAERLHALPSVAFRTLLQGSHLVYEGEAENAVIRSAEDWEGFLARHPHNDPAPFGLDFAREQGVLVQLGPQPTGMIGVAIVAIEEQPERFVVHAVRWLPSSDLVTDDIGYPTHYVAMAKSGKPVKFAPLIEARDDEQR